MLYAKFMYPNNGYDGDIEYAKNAKLKLKERYEIDYINMGGFYTSIYLKDIEGCFNSVQFVFEDEYGLPVDIYEISDFSSYNI